MNILKNPIKSDVLAIRISDVCEYGADCAIVIQALRDFCSDDEDSTDGWFWCGGIYKKLSYFSESKIDGLLISLFERNYIDLCKKYSVSDGCFDELYCQFLTGEGTGD